MKEFITHINTIHSLSSQAEKALRNICSEVFIVKGKELQAIGNRCTNIYFVVDGLLRIYYLKNGVDITESFEAEQALVARADSLFDARPSRKGIQALEDTQLVAVNTPRLFTLYDQYHDIERLFRIVFEQAYVKTVERIEQLQFHTAEERYQNLLANAGSIVQRAPLKHIASYLGITQVSLSRIRAKF
ncbi:cyclic nucleotide-binding protein [marine bacterium AO1-C]|nr:cyclic nucleotide-binding protein [marine bacterium AO1-C]